MTQPFEMPTDTKQPSDSGRAKLIEGFFDGIRDRMRDRRESRGKSESTPPTPSGMLENEGSIASITKPKGFNNKSEDSDFGRFVSFSDGKSKVCYWKREDYSPTPDSAKKLEAVLKKGPHTILSKDPKNPDVTIAAEDELDPVYDCLMPGRWSKGGPFDVNNISVQNINGKNVLSVDVQFQDGKKRSVMIFSPDAKNNTLEHIWSEAGTKADVDKLNKTIVSSIKWKAK